MKTVILTGASGFIGRQMVAPLLERGFRVHAVSQIAPTEDLIFENVVRHRVNLLDEGETTAMCEKIKATHLLHFAWYVEHGKFWNAPENKIWLGASRRLIEQFKASGGERIVAAGTCAEYEWGKDRFLSEEKTPLKPQNFYGECKLELQKTLAETEISQAWGRVFFLFGEYENPRRLVASVINSLVQNEYADCSHGRQIRDFMYVRDVSDAFAALLDSDIQDAVNIASGKARTIKEIILQAADLLGKRELIRFGKIAAAENEPESIVADTRRLREELGWTERYGIERGLEQTIEFWKHYENND
jgi:nucleoside-diphosphate-sugar epimerase